MFVSRIFWRIYFVNLLLVAFTTISISIAVTRELREQIEYQFPAREKEMVRVEIEQMELQVTRITWGVFIGGSLIAAIVSLFVSDRISKPLAKITLASQAMKTGKPGQLVDIQRADEIGKLATSFNAMSRTLAVRIEESEQQSLQLKEYSERLSTVLGGVVEGVIAVDSDEAILFANDAAFRMIEFEGSDIVGRPYWEVFRNSDVQKVVRDVVSGQFQLRREIVIPRTQARIEFNASRLPGTPYPGVVLVLHEVTALRKLEKVRSEFVSNVGHELKTPVTAIQACTETLFDGAIEDPDHAQHFLKQISDHADRLHKLIIDLMELAKIESEDEPFHLKDIDVGIPIQEAIDEHLQVAKSKKIVLTSEPTIEELIVHADLDGVRTIINNLLDNAISYTASEGTVSIKWFEEEHHAVIQITDSGVGIKHKHLTRIFERFYCVDSARSRQAGGTGLGLAIVKHLCQFFFGSISVESEPGVGSTFTVKFPLVTAPE